MNVAKIEADNPSWQIKDASFFLKLLFDMKKVFLTIIMLLTLVGGINAQSVQNKKVEVDLSISPAVPCMGFSGMNIQSADLAVRYLFGPHFSAGIGVTPTFFDGIDFYAPLELSFRYNMMPDSKLSPYMLLNVAASFIQMSDYCYQARFAMGVNYQLDPRCSLFAEVGMAAEIDGLWWAPMSFGLRF